MNKKEYIKPTMMVAEMETEYILQVSGGDGPSTKLVTFDLVDGEDGEEME